MRDRILDRHRRVGRFAVGLDRDPRALRLGHTAGRARARRLRGRQVAEPLRDFFLHRLRIEITDGDHGHQVGAIPVLVVADERLDWRLLDDLRLTDRDAVRVARALEHHLRVLVEQPHAGAAAEPPLLEHYAALLRDLVRVERDVGRPVAQDVEALVHVVGLVARNLELIDGLVPRRVRVEIGAEPHADALEIAHELVLLEPLRAVERHVLVEVSEPALIVVLLHRAGVDSEPEQCAFLGLLVLQDVIGQAVRQHALLELGPQR
jgi:hypothetical protein